jgi:hypothetical protein
MGRIRESYVRCSLRSQLASAFSLRPDKTECLRLNVPRGSDISHHFDVESEGCIVPVHGGMSCSLCGFPIYCCDRQE